MAMGLRKLDPKKEIRKSAFFSNSNDTSMPRQKETP